MALDRQAFYPILAQARLESSLFPFPFSILHARLISPEIGKIMLKLLDESGILDVGRIDG